MHGNITEQGKKAATSERLERVGDAFGKKANVLFTTLDQIETDPDRDNYPTAGNAALELIVDTMKKDRVPIEETVRGVYTSLGISFEELHNAMCNCKNGDTILGEHMRHNFWELADKYAKQKQ